MIDVLGSLLHAHTPGPSDDFWYEPVGGGTTASGLRIGPEAAQKISAWYRGRDLLATSLAMLPLVMLRRLPNDGGRDSARDHPLHDVLHRKPNRYQNAFQWRRQAMYHLIDYGNAYSEIVPGVRGFVDALRPLHPNNVRVELSVSGEKVFIIRDPTTSEERRGTSNTVFHLCGASEDGVVGKGILAYARDSIGLGVVLEQYASKLFGRGGTHGGFITPTGPVAPEAQKAFAEAYLAKVGDWHVPKILPRGATFQPSTMDPEKAQLILSRKFTINDIARWLGVPPHMIGDLDRATFSNIEEMAEEFVTYSLGPWLSLMEFSINDQLVLRPDTYYAEFVRDALVRGKLLDRWQAYVMGSNAGLLAKNEVRAKENLPKVPGGDVPNDPANIIGNRRQSEGAPPSGRPARRTDTPQRTDTADAIAVAAAKRVLWKEVRRIQALAVKHAADENAFVEAVTEFYAEHMALVVDALAMTPEAASDYCSQQAAQVVGGDWVEAVTRWQQDAYVAGLAALALDEEAA